MQFINPEEIINSLPLEGVRSVADFGCGSGGWVLPLSRRFKDGAIYAVDILSEPLSSLSGTLNREGISNVKTLNENIEDNLSIRDGAVDLVLMTNFLFQVDDKEKVFSEAKRVLPNGGLILVIDWKPSSVIAPRVEKVNPEQVKQLAKSANLELKEEFDAGLHHYGFLYQKND